MNDKRGHYGQARRALIRIAAGVGRRPEPVVRSPRNLFNPKGVEQITCMVSSMVQLFDPDRVGQNYCTLNHGFRFAAPAAIIVMTPTGSMEDQNE
jgi:hypothetical protein